MDAREHTTRKRGSRVSGEDIPRVRAVAVDAPAAGPQWMGGNRSMPTVSSFGGRIPNSRDGAMNQQRSIFEVGRGQGFQTNQVRSHAAAAPAAAPHQLAHAPRPQTITRNAYQGRPNLGQATDSTSKLTAIAVLAGVVVVAAGIFLIAD